MEDLGMYESPESDKEDVPEAYCITINIRDQNRNQQRRTLLHEMCHHAVFVSNKEKYFNGEMTWHGKVWRNEMRRVGFKGVITSRT